MLTDIIIFYKDPFTARLVWTIISTKSCKIRRQPEDKNILAGLRKLCDLRNASSNTVLQNSNVNLPSLASGIELERAPR